MFVFIHLFCILDQKNYGTRDLFSALRKTWKKIVTCSPHVFTKNELGKTKTNLEIYKASAEIRLVEKLFLKFGICFP